MPDTNAGNLCKCGCGQRLPLYSKREWKNGHKKAFNKAVNREYVNTIRTERGDEAKPNPTLNTDNVTVNPGTTNPTVEGGGKNEEFPSWTDSIPNDPDPDLSFREGKDEPKSDPPLVVTKAIQQDIHGKLTFLLGMSSSMMVTMDPLCVGEFQKHLPNITAKMVPIICQSPDMVKFFTKSGGFILWLDLATACWPVVQIIIAHHVTKSLKVENGEVLERDMSQYKA